MADVERWLSYKGTCHVNLVAKLHDMYFYKTDNFCTSATISLYFFFLLNLVAIQYFQAVKARNKLRRVIGKDEVQVMGPLNLDVKFVKQNMNPWDADSEIGRTTPIDDLSVDGKWAVPPSVSRQSNHSGIIFICFLRAEWFH